MPQKKMAPYHCVCLLLLSLVHLAFSQNDTSRIVDGVKVSQGEFPFVVSLLDEHRNHFCTASILNDNTILTAAHCLKGRDGSKLAVYLGNVDLSKRRINLKYVYKGKQAIVHQHYNPRIYTADIAVLKLEKSISGTRYTQQTCLPTAENAPNLENCIAIGWGLMAHLKGTSILQKLNMRLTKKCRSLADPKRVFCAVGAKGKGGACYGDSGGPLLCSVKSKPSLWLQYGVASYIDTKHCQGASYYMKVSPYLAWIQKYAQD